MPTNRLTSAAITALVTRGESSILSRRNFSSYRRHNGTPVRDKMIQLLGLVVGSGTDTVSELEAERQKLMVEYSGHSDDIVDLREKMWPGLRKSWSDLMKKISSDT